jgi:hypothetical protein
MISRDIYIYYAAGVLQGGAETLRSLDTLRPVAARMASLVMYLVMYQIVLEREARGSTPVVR